MATLHAARIISSGNEILQGLYPDTNAQRFSRILLESGFRVISHAVAPDDASELRGILTHALGGCSLVVVNGGLGPTEDDVNREVIAQVTGRSLVFDERSATMMRKRFHARGIEMPERNLKQAYVPEGAIILHNHWGTAAGFLVPGSAEQPAVIALPGPPSECVPMLKRAIEKHFEELFPLRSIRYIHTLHLAMIPESTINERVAHLFNADPDSEVTLLAGRGHIRMRVISSAGDLEAARLRALRIAEEASSLIGADYIFAEGPENASLDETVLKIMQANGSTLSLAESCTGGWIAKRLTDFAGSSATLLAGFVTYSNESKTRELGVPAELIERCGAVSEEVVRAMAEGARRVSGSDYSVAVSGVAGPGGGSTEKPVGTVWFAVSGPEATHSLKLRFPGDRETVRMWSVNQSLDMLRRVLTGAPVTPEIPALIPPKPR